MLKEDLENVKIVNLVSRTTQTDASSFKYKTRRKAQEIETEGEKVFDNERDLKEFETQTEWSHFADKLIEAVKKTTQNYNLRSRIKN